MYHLLYDKGHYFEGLLDHDPFTLIFINTLLLATDFFSDYTVVNCSYFCVHIKKKVNVLNRQRLFDVKIEGALSDVFVFFYS